MLSRKRSTICLILAASALASCRYSPRFAADASGMPPGLGLPDAPASWTAAEPRSADLLVSVVAGWDAPDAYEPSPDAATVPDAVPGAAAYAPSTAPPSTAPGTVDAACAALGAADAAAARVLAQRVVAREFYAVAADWLDPRESVDPAGMSLDEARALSEPLSSIRLPRKVLAYGGLYPGDPGYPLVRALAVTVASAPGAADAGSGKRISAFRLRRLEAAARDYLSGLPEPAALEGLSWLGAVGDVMPGQGTSAMLLEPGGLERVFGRLLPVMRAQDLLVANLETAVTDRGVEWPKTFRFRMPAAALAPLKDSGIDLVGLANNHVFDYTEIGFSDTLEALEAAGLPYIGAGPSRERAIAPFESAAGSQPVSVWALGKFPVERTGFYGLKHASVQRGQPGLLWADDEAVRDIGEAMRAAGAAGRLCVVSVHAGLEYTYGPYAVQTDLYRTLVDLGADVVLGHHPHVLQPMEWYEGAKRSGLIVYSLGNFVFDNVEDNPRGFETILLSLGLSDGTVRSMRVYPARMDGYTVDMADDGDPTSLARSLSAAWAEKSATAGE